MWLDHCPCYAYQNLLCSFLFGLFFFLGKHDSVMNILRYVQFLFPEKFNLSLIIAIAVCRKFIISGIRTLIGLKKYWTVRYCKIFYLNFFCFYYFFQESELDKPLDKGMFRFHKIFHVSLFPTIFRIWGNFLKNKGLMSDQALQQFVSCQKHLKGSLLDIYSHSLHFLIPREVENHKSGCT